MEDRIFKFITTKKFLTFFVCLLIIAFTIAWIILVKNETKVTELDESDITLADPASYRSDIEVALWERDAVSITDDYVYLYGWILKPGTSVQKVAIHMVLKDISTGNYYVVPTDVIERTDITEQMADGNNYNYSGFSMQLPHWDALDGQTDYEIFAQYELNDEASVIVPLNATLKTKAAELLGVQ